MLDQERPSLCNLLARVLPVIFAVVLDERQVFHAVERADGVGIGHIHTVREHLDGYLDLVTAHDLGLDGDLVRPKARTISSPVV